MSDQIQKEIDQNQQLLKKILGTKRSHENPEILLKDKNKLWYLCYSMPMAVKLALTERHKEALNVRQNSMERKMLYIN